MRTTLSPRTTVVSLQNGLRNVERLREIDFCEVVCSPSELEAALQRRLDALSLAWTTSSS